jgi:hypothetical protein
VAKSGKKSNREVKKPKAKKPPAPVAAGFIKPAGPAPGPKRPAT